jgi:uncharacterized integral membrane protein
MKYNIIKGYVLIVLSGLFFLAVAILLISNSNTDAVWFFGTDFQDYSLGLVMLISGVTGIVAWWVGVLMIRGIKALRKGRQRQALDRVKQANKDAKPNSTGQ